MSTSTFGLTTSNVTLPVVVVPATCTAPPSRTSTWRAAFMSLFTMTPMAMLFWGTLTLLTTAAVATPTSILSMDRVGQTLDLRYGFELSLVSVLTVGFVLLLALPTKLYAPITYHLMATMFIVYTFVLSEQSPFRVIRAMSGWEALDMTAIILAIVWLVAHFGVATSLVFMPSKGVRVTGLATQLLFTMVYALIVAILPVSMLYHNGLIETIFVVALMLQFTYVIDEEVTLTHLFLAAR